MTLPLGEFVAVWLFLAANIASPGPNVLNTVALAMGSGRRAGLGSACGVGLGIGLWCLSMVLGVAAVIRVVPGAERALVWAAVALLALFSWRYLRAALAGWRDGGHGAWPCPRERRAGDSRRAFGGRWR